MFIFLVQLVLAAALIAGAIAFPIPFIALALLGLLSKAIFGANEQR